MARVLISYQFTHCNLIQFCVGVSTGMIVYLHAFPVACFSTRVLTSGLRLFIQTFNLCEF